MENVIQYTSQGEYIKVVLKSGASVNSVIICPDPFDPYSRKHILEKSNGDTTFINTNEIKGIMLM